MDYTGRLYCTINETNLEFILNLSVSMEKIVEQVQAAFQFVRHKFPYTTGVHIMGHSAGAHLATMVLAQPAHDFPSLLPITVYPVSGIYDLR